MSTTPAVDPRAPRFGQGITAAFALVAVVLQEPLLAYAITIVLVVPVLTRWRVDPYRLLWRHGVRHLLGPPAETESPIPHRFARVIGAVMTTLASAGLLAGAATGTSVLALAGYGALAVVGLLAALSAVTGFCLGCRMYRQVSLFRDWRLLTSPAEEQQPAN